MRPLFVPLRKRYFERFESGEASTEYRLHGKQWNERVCALGRDVVLSCGFGKARRLWTTIARVELLSCGLVPGAELIYPGDAELIAMHFAEIGSRPWHDTSS